MLPRDVPIFSHTGFTKVKIDDAFMETLRGAYTLLQSFKKEEPKCAYINGLCNLYDLGRVDALLGSSNTTPFITQILNHFDGVFKEWLPEAKLKPFCVYGIREYTYGTTLALHVDRILTHHISAIVNIDQEVYSEWPLDICDHSGNWHKITIKQGEAILYESATCQHGRIQPLNGNYYCNIFVHFSIEGL